MDDDTPLSENGSDVWGQRHLVVLRWLVTGLTATMIVGLITLIWLFVTRLPDARSVPLPDSVTLPGGGTATAFTRGPDWLAVVVDGDEILIFDADGTTLRQRIAISRPDEAAQE